MAVSRKQSLLRIVSANRYFSQPKYCKHCGLTNYESEPSLPSPRCLSPIIPKNNSSNHQELFIYTLALNILICRSDFQAFPHLLTSFLKKKEKKKQDDITM